jgi:glucose/arabinose dehydrogenase
MLKKFSAAMAIIAAFTFPVHTIAQPHPTISYDAALVSGLAGPVDLVNAGDGTNRLFIVQQNGVILVRTVTPSVAVNTFVDLGTSTGPSGLNLISFGGERGLLSMAFHPDYNGTTNRFFYVYYTEITTGRIIIDRFETTVGNINTVDAASRLQIMAIDHPGQANHNGGKLNFGPDGYLYFATGDGGGGNDVPNNAQNGNVLLGKMIRIDVNNPVAQTYGNYVIPPTNPYVSDPAILDEIWALGLRNPFRWSFDRLTNDMWIGDVGQSAREEINYRAAGSTGHVNYGWRCYEGLISTPSVPDCTPTDNVFPIFDYDNNSVGIAVTGGFVYRGPDNPTLYGRYIASDYGTGVVFIISPNSSGGWYATTQTNPVSGFNPAGFGEAEDGTLYIVGDGEIRRITATAGFILPVKLSNYSAHRVDQYNELKWTTTFEDNTSRFHIEYSTDGRNFNRAGNVVARGNSNGGDYSYKHQVAMTNDLYYRLAIEDKDGSIKYSSILKLLAAKGVVKLFPTIVRNGMLNISVSGTAKKLQLVNNTGAVVFEKNLAGFSGASAIQLPALARGSYIARIILNDGILHEKLVIE